MKQRECILMIDDDKITNILHEELIGDLSIFKRIEIAKDGAEALEKISNLSQEGIYPCLIFLDVNMAGMNGFEFLEAYHYLRSIVKCPIIMVSTSALYMDKEKAEILGVDGYYTKPLTKDRVQKIIDKHLS